MTLLRRVLLITASLALIAASLAVAPPAEPNCQLDHNATLSVPVTDNITTNQTVRVEQCDALPNERIGVSYTNNRTIQIQSGSPELMAKVYIHEMGHQLGHNHSQDGIMQPELSAEVTAGTRAEEIARAVNTTAVDSNDRITTPYNG